MAERQADESRADEPLVILCPDQEYQQAALIRQALDAERIPAPPTGRTRQPSGAWGPALLTQMKVLVRESDRPKAVEILKGVEEELGQDMNVIEEE